MPDIALPEVHLPDVRLPEGLRDMKIEDIQRAVAERRVPKIDLAKMELPKAIEEHLPKSIDERIPHHHRRNGPPMALIVAGVVAFGAWLLLASPLAPRIRRAVDDARSRMGMGGMDEADELLDDFDERIDDAMSTAGPTGGSGFEPDRGPVGVGPGFESASMERTVWTEGERPL
jgi:hypothetical protein